VKNFNQTKKLDTKGNIFEGEETISEDDDDVEVVECEAVVELEEESIEMEEVYGEDNAEVEKGEMEDSGDMAAIQEMLLADNSDSEEEIDETIPGEDTNGLKEPLTSLSETELGQHVVGEVKSVKSKEANKVGKRGPRKSLKLKESAITDNIGGESIQDSNVTNKEAENNVFRCIELAKSHGKNLQAESMPGSFESDNNADETYHEKDTARQIKDVDQIKRGAVSSDSDLPRKKPKLQDIHEDRGSELESSKETITCILCYKTFLKVKTLREHKRTHKEDRIYFKKALSEVDLKFECRETICGQKFVTENILNYHNKTTHKDINLFKRKPIRKEEDVPNKYNNVQTEGNQNSLSSVISTQIDEKMCILCYKNFPNVRILKDHQRIHKDDTIYLNIPMSESDLVFKCGEDVCGKKFVTENILKYHTKTLHKIAKLSKKEPSNIHKHDQDKLGKIFTDEELKFVCDQDKCYQKFVSVDTFKFHKKEHTQHEVQKSVQLETQNGKPNRLETADLEEHIAIAIDNIFAIDNPSANETEESQSKQTKEATSAAEHDAEDERKHKPEEDESAKESSKNGAEMASSHLLCGRGCGSKYRDQAPLQRHEQVCTHGEEPGSKEGDLPDESGNIETEGNQTCHFIKENTVISVENGTTGNEEEEHTQEVKVYVDSTMEENKPYEGEQIETKPSKQDPLAAAQLCLEFFESSSMEEVSVSENESVEESHDDMETKIECTIITEKSKTQQSNDTSKLPEKYCNLCHYEFSRAFDFRKHKAKRHSNGLEDDSSDISGQFSCEGCDKTFMREEFQKFHKTHNKHNEQKESIGTKARTFLDDATLGGEHDSNGVKGSVASQNFQFMLDILNSGQ